MKLNKYVIELWHEPGISPLSNAAYRKKASNTHEVLPGLMEKRGMKMIGAYHRRPYLPDNAACGDAQMGGLPGDRLKP